MENRRNQRGFTIIEVMVAIGIFSIALIGVIGISTVVVYYNAISRQVSIAQMFGMELESTLQNLTSDPGTTFLNSAFTDTNSGNNSSLAFIDLTNDPPTSPAPEHSEAEIGLASPVYEGVIYQRFWNVADIDQNNDGIIEAKQIAVIVRWKRSNESSYHYSVISTGLYRPPGT